MSVIVKDTFRKLWFCDTQPVCLTFTYSEILGSPADYAANYVLVLSALSCADGPEEHEELEEHDCSFEEEHRSRRDICPNRLL